MKTRKNPEKSPVASISVFWTKILTMVFFHYSAINVVNILGDPELYNSAVMEQILFSLLKPGWMTEYTHPRSWIHLSTFFRKDMSRNGGGILVACKQELNPLNRYAIETRRTSKLYGYKKQKLNKERFLMDVCTILIRNATE